MIPKMRQVGSRAVSIPEMSGGVNLRDGISFIKDNQLSDCENLWHKNSLLCTRPALKGDANPKNLMAWYDEGGEPKVRIHGDVVKTTPDGEYVLQVSCHKRNAPTCCIYEFHWINVNNPANVQQVKGERYDAYSVNADETTSEELIDNYVCYMYEGVVYFLSGRDVLTIRDNKMQKLNPSDIDNGLYVPTVLTNGKPGEDATGVLINGYNALGGYYKAEYSLVNADNTSVEKGIAVKFRLPINTAEYDTFGTGNSVRDLVGYTVRVEVTTEKGTVVHEAKIVRNSFSIYAEEIDHNIKDGFKMRYAPETGCVILTPNAAKTYTYMQNNVIITVPYKSPGFCSKAQKAEYDMIFGMKQATWFGGSAQGMYGGTRVFLCGNDTAEHKSVMCWSHRDTPTYFPVNCYAYVGYSDQRITAFGKQGNALIIFKESEVYASTYLQGETPTVEALENQEVIDLTVNTAIFPLTLINPNIGCDCPDTVQLCRNRLVWAHSSGHVYTLVSGSNTTERSIYDISEMVESLLRGRAGELKVACSADHEGKYMLFCGQDVLVMDYNSYGYNHAYSYQKTEDANVNIPWWPWKLPLAPGNAYSRGEILFLPYVGRDAKLQNANGEYVYIHNAYMDGSEGDDSLYRVDDSVEPAEGQETPLVRASFIGWNEPIHSRAVTKAFDFGAPSLGKNITGVHITFGNNECAPITVNFLSDDNRPDKRRVELMNTGMLRTAIRFLKTVLLHPRARGVQAFSMELEADGKMLLGPVSIVYEVLGPVR